MTLPADGRTPVPAPCASSRLFTAYFSSRFHRRARAHSASLHRWGRPTQRTAGCLPASVAITAAIADAMRRILVEKARRRKRVRHGDPAAADVVNLHFFVGMTLDETAEALGVSRATTCRHWAYARAL